MLLFLGIAIPPLCVIKWRSSRPSKFTAPIAVLGVTAPGAVFYDYYRDISVEESKLISPPYSLIDHFSIAFAMCDPNL